MQDFQTLEPTEDPPFKIGEDGYFIREPDDATASRYEYVRLMGADFDDDGTFKGVKDLDQLSRSSAVLVGGCLFKQGAVKAVGEQFAAGLKRTISRPIFERCQELYRLSLDNDSAKKV